MTGFKVERALFHWSAVVDRAPSGWSRDFARSIAAQSRRRGWRPSPKQAEIMHRMVNELFIESPEHEEDIAVIE